MWERLQRFRDLDPVARGLFLRAWVVLPLISLSLAIRGFGATQAFLQRFLPSENAGFGSAAAPAFDPALRVARMVRAAAYFGVGNFTCLEKSLTLWWLLGRQGIESTVRIGARKDQQTFEAHAWVERGGTVLQEQDEPERLYAVFEGRFPMLPSRVR
jgi:hypothetical protein